MAVNITFSVFFCVAVISAVISSQSLNPVRQTRSVTPSDYGCETGCSTTEDCPAGLSCFSATTENKGCCLNALKPNETGCVIDDQCKRACESTHCDKTQASSRCLCDSGSHFLFNKCWKRCPEFAHPDPVVDDTGFSQCQLKVDSRTASLYMRRNKRQLRSNPQKCTKTAKRTRDLLVLAKDALLTTILFVFLEKR